MFNKAYNLIQKKFLKGKTMYTSCLKNVLNIAVPYFLELKLFRPEKNFQDLTKCATGLKVILGRIPDQIYDRKQFLETIK